MTPGFVQSDGWIWRDCSWVKKWESERASVTCNRLIKKFPRNILGDFGVRTEPGKKAKSNPWPIGGI